MRIESRHIQPMKMGALCKYAANRGKQVFLLSIPGNLLVLLLFSTILFGGFAYAESLGVEENTLYTLSIFNNLLFISLTSVNIFYLLTLKSEQAYFDQVKRALIKTLKVTPTLIVATLLYAIVVTLGLLLLIIPGLVLYAYLGLFAQTIAFENRGIISSLIRSRELVKGSFWKVFLSLLVLLLITNITVLIIGAIILSFLSNPVPMLEEGIYSVAYVLFMPFVGSFYALLYFDLRTRQEAFDYASFEREVMDESVI
jgi:ABC-type polysaccharide transport system permease subunit